MRHDLKPRKMTLSEVDQKLKKRLKNDIFWIKIRDSDLRGISCAAKTRSALVRVSFLDLGTRSDQLRVK